MKSLPHDALKNWNGSPTLLLQVTIQDMVSELDNDVQKKGSGYQVDKHSRKISSGNQSGCP